jgi:hypothetical protein
MRVEIFALARAWRSGMHRVYSVYYLYNNKLSRLDACPSATREGKNFNTHFWAAYVLITKLSISQHIYVRYDIIRNISFNLR